MGVNVNMELTSIQAFNILCQTLGVVIEEEPPRFYVNENNEIACDSDDRGELYLAMYHLATKICPNTEFRDKFENPNKLMCELYEEMDLAREFGD